MAAFNLTPVWPGENATRRRLKLERYEIADWIDGLLRVIFSNGLLLLEEVIHEMARKVKRP